jgi:hypothetical protein
LLSDPVCSNPSGMVKVVNKTARSSSNKTETSASPKKL